MMKFGSILLLCLFIVPSCKTQNNGKNQAAKQSNLEPEPEHQNLQMDSPSFHPDGKDIISRFPPPNGFDVAKEAESSFGYFLQHLPLKADGELVTYYDGSKKPNYNVYAAVIDLPIGTKNLHQCADAVIRLRADYLNSQNLDDNISFHFTNGFLAEYSKWKKGNRIVVNGNQVQWKAGNPKQDDYWAYLEQVFMYAGTLSLEKELQSKSIESLNIGDVFIRGGSPGHAVIVVNKATNSSTGEIAYMLAQSYMPAQELQVLYYPNTKNVWYFVTDKEKINTPEWTFNSSQLKSFQ